MDIQVDEEELEPTGMLSKLASSSGLQVPGIQGKKTRKRLEAKEIRVDRDAVKALAPAKYFRDAGDEVVFDKMQPGEWINDCLAKFSRGKWMREHFMSNLLDGPNAKQPNDDYKDKEEVMRESAQVPDAEEILCFIDMGELLQGKDEKDCIVFTDQGLYWRNNGVIESEISLNKKSDNIRWIEEGSEKGNLMDWTFIKMGVGGYVAACKLDGTVVHRLPICEKDYKYCERFVTLIKSVRDHTFPDRIEEFQNALGDTDWEHQEQEVDKNNLKEHLLVAKSEGVLARLRKWDDSAPKFSSKFMGENPVTGEKGLELLLGPGIALYLRFLLIVGSAFILAFLIVLASVILYTQYEVFTNAGEPYESNWRLHTSLGNVPRTELTVFPFQALDIL